MHDHCLLELGAARNEFGGQNGRIDFGNRDLEYFGSGFGGCHEKHYLSVVSALSGTYVVRPV